MNEKKGEGGKKENSIFIFLEEQEAWIPEAESGLWQPDHITHHFLKSVRRADCIERYVMVLVTDFKISLRINGY